MNRRKFFGFVPAVAAVPFIAKEIITSGDTIHIVKPEVIKDIKPPIVSGVIKDGRFDWNKCTLQVINEDGEVMGEGIMTALNVEYQSIDVSTRDSSVGMHSVMVPSMRTITVEGMLTDLIMI